MAETKLENYRISYKKYGESENCFSASCDSIETVYKAICSSAQVKSTMDLEKLEIHLIKSNGEIHVYNPKAGEEATPPDAKEEAKTLSNLPVPVTPKPLPRRYAINRYEVHKVPLEA